MKWNPLRLTGCDDQGAYGITDGWRGERATAAFSLRWSEILKYCWEKKRKRVEKVAAFINDAFDAHEASGR